MSSGYPSGRDQRGRVHQPIQPCTGCGRPMLWVTMPSGKRNPVEYEPRPNDPQPNILVVERDDPHLGAWRLGVQLHDRELVEEAIAAGFRVTTSHFADRACPRNARRERKDIDG